MKAWYCELDHIVKGETDNVRWYQNAYGYLMYDYISFYAIIMYMIACLSSDIILKLKLTLSFHYNNDVNAALFESNVDDS